jgi:hypothetical protein
MNVTGIPAAGVQSGGREQSKITLPTSTANLSNATAYASFAKNSLKASNISL